MRDKVTAEVILPSNQKRRLTCAVCGMSYTPKEYKILYENKKLIYFKFYGLNEKKYKIICHDCVWNVIGELSNGEDLDFRIIGEKEVYECTFDPDEFTDPNNDDEYGDFFDFE